MKFKYVLNIVFFIVTFSVYSQVNFETILSKKTLGINERLRVDFVLNEDGDNFIPPSFDNFKVVGGPSQSIKNSWVNGLRSYSKTYTYYLSPIKIGEFVIAQASIEINGEIYKTLISSVKVTGAIEIPSNPNDPNYIVGQNVHFVAEVSDTRPFLNQAITLVYKLYFSTDLMISNPRLIESQKYVNFWSQSIDMNELQVERGTYRGLPYNYVVISRTILYPQKVDKLFIDPLAIELNIQVPSNRRDFFGQRITRSVQKTITASSKKINVVALPLENKPDNFSNAVGNFNFKVSSSKQNLNVSEALQLDIEVNGKGNLKLFNLPKTVLSSNLELYEPERKDNIKVGISGMSGYMKDQYTVVPSVPGKYKIPSISFSYFDPLSKSYETTDSEEILINVSGNSTENIVTENKTQINKLAVVQLNNNFLPFKTKTRLNQIKNTKFFNSYLFWTLFVIPIIFSIILLVLIKYYFKRKDLLLNDRSRNAKKIGKKYLSEAQKNIGNKELFYNALDKALLNYLKSILDFENSDFNKAKITILLQQKSVSGETNEVLENIFKNCELARYTPITDVEMKKDYDKAINVISKIDKEIK